jgi:hypothetical protein
MTDVNPGVDEVFVATRRQLHRVAEILIAGPQHRALGTIRLSVHPDGFGGAALPVAVRGTELVWPQGSAPLAGPVSRLAGAAGIAAGPPVGVYHSSQPLAIDTVLDVDPDAAALVERSLYVGAQALKVVVPEQDPVLWPEHFDVSVTLDEVNYGVSPGDDYHPRPYAYVGPAAARTGPFWNAPFGALRPLGPVDGVAGVADFFEQGRLRASLDPTTDKEHTT